MKKSIIIISALFISGMVYSQTVSVDSLKYYEGKVITVCSEVTGTFVTKSESKTTFINFGDFPRQKLTVIIYGDNLRFFKYSPAEFLKGKKICITGDVRMYNGGPEILVETEEQISVVE